MKQTEIKVTFNGKVLLSDKMDAETLQTQLKNGFKSLATAVNLVTRTGGRKGMTHIMEIDGEKCLFKGGSFGSSIVKSLASYIMETSGNVRLEDAKNIANAKLSGFTVSAGAIQQVKMFDDYLEGKILAEKITKVIEVEAVKVEAIEAAAVTLK